MPIGWRFVFIVLLSDFLAQDVEPLLLSTDGKEPGKHSGCLNLEKIVVLLIYKGIDCFCFLFLFNLKAVIRNHFLTFRRFKNV